MQASAAVLIDILRLQGVVPVPGAPERDSIIVSHQSAGLLILPTLIDTSSVGSGSRSNGGLVFYGPGVAEPVQSQWQGQAGVEEEPLPGPSSAE